MSDLPPLDQAPLVYEIDGLHPVSFYEEIEEAIRALPIPPDEYESYHGVGKSLELLRSLEGSEGNSSESPREDTGPNDGDAADRPVVCGLHSSSQRVRPRRSRAKAVAAPVPEDSQASSPRDEFVYPDFGPSKLTVDSLNGIFTKLGGCERVWGRIPKSDDRPWDPPEGRVCMYECYFSKCGLWFPLPKLLTDYCARRRIAVAQLSDASIRNIVGLMILGAQTGIEVDVDVLEEMTIFGVRKDGLCTLNSKSGKKITSSSTNKTYDWRSRYFFVKVSKNSVEDPDAVLISDWNFTPGSP